MKGPDFLLSRVRFEIFHHLHSHARAHKHTKHELVTLESCVWGNGKSCYNFLDHEARLALAMASTGNNLGPFSVGELQYYFVMAPGFTQTCKSDKHVLLFLGFAGIFDVPVTSARNEKVHAKLNTL